MRTRTYLLWLTLAAATTACGTGQPPLLPDGGCRTPADCPDPLAYSCSNGVCRSLSGDCMEDADCPDPAAPRCSNGACVACASDVDCVDPASPRCSDGSCVACLTGDDCRPGGLCQAGICLPTGCANDDQCLDPLSPFCLAGDCVQCRTDVHCPDPAANVCRAGTCQSDLCVTDGDCPDPQQPYCLAGGCVQCRTAAHCPDPENQLCTSGTCQTQVSCGDGPRPQEFTWPCPQSHSYCQAFGVPIDYQTCGFHTGLDTCGSDGEPILSMADGRVVHVGPMWLDGAGVGRGPYAIIVQHSPGFYSTYGHNRTARVQEGACVTRGQTIAEMGNLGYSYGPHLHLEVLTNTSFTGDWQTPFSNACNHYEDPMDYVQP